MTTHARDNAGRFTRTLCGAQRDAEACRLRACGYSYEAIAKQLSYGNRGNAHRAVQTALSSTVREGADELRELALIELDEMAREGWAVLRREHILVSGGRVVKQDGKPVPDDGPVLAALDRLLKIAERRVRLLGLDAAVKSRVEVITADMIEAEITRLEAELAGHGDGGG